MTNDTTQRRVRKPRSEKRNLPYVMAFRVDAEALADIKAAAVAEGVSTATYLRRCVTWDSVSEAAGLNRRPR